MSAIMNMWRQKLHISLPTRYAVAARRDDDNRRHQQQQQRTALQPKWEKRKGEKSPRAHKIIEIMHVRMFYTEKMPSFISCYNNLVGILHVSVLYAFAMHVLYYLYCYWGYLCAHMHIYIFNTIVAWWCECRMRRVKCERIESVCDMSVG